MIRSASSSPCANSLFEARDLRPRSWLNWRTSNHEQRNSDTGIASQDRCLLARRQLSVGWPDLPLRQSAPQRATEAVAREAARGRHWGTTPGQNFIYVHLNRLIKKYDLDMIYIAGPGH